MTPHLQIMSNLALRMMLQQLQRAGYWPDRINSLKAEIKRRKQKRLWKL